MKLFQRRDPDRAAAERLYADAVLAARRPILFTDYGVPDSLEGRFEMIALHLFALIHRLMHDPGDDPKLARLVTESFVADMDGALREMGVGDLSVPKRMKALYGSFAGRISAYEAAIRAGEGDVVAAIGRNVFPDSSDGGRAAPLAKHLLAMTGAIAKADLADLRRGDASFPLPAHIQAEALP